MCYVKTRMANTVLKIFRGRFFDLRCLMGYAIMRIYFREIK